jgi:hypothetical protein
MFRLTVVVDVAFSGVPWVVQRYQQFQVCAGLHLFTSRPVE